MKALGLKLIGIDINENGLDFDLLEVKLEKYKDKIKFAYI